MSKTLFEKIWDAHVVAPETADTPATLYIDLHLVHEVTSPQAFDELRARGLKLRRPDRTLATLDHSTPTLPPDANGERPYATPAAKAQVAQLEANTAAFGVAAALRLECDQLARQIVAAGLGPARERVRCRPVP